MSQRDCEFTSNKYPNKLNKPIYFHLKRFNIKIHFKKMKFMSTFHSCSINLLLQNSSHTACLSMKKISMKIIYYLLKSLVPTLSDLLFFIFILTIIFIFRVFFDNGYKFSFKGTAKRFLIPNICMQLM